MLQDHDPLSEMKPGVPTYSRAARSFHWVTAAAVIVMLPLGFWMTYRGNELDLWDDLTNALYSSHKLLGFLLLWLTGGRLLYRLVRGAPPDEPGLTRVERGVGRLVHWALYGLLLAIPILGWIGISLYPALDIFGLFNLPALAAPDEEAAQRVLSLHGRLAILLAVLVGVHVLAGLCHHFIQRNGVLRRMLPRR